jgi:hypothetical protein
MKVRLSLIALLSALAVPAMASSGFTPGRGEASFKTHPMASTKTRDQVKRELEAWKRNPVSADGWREVGGEAGWIFEGSDGTAKSRSQVRQEVEQARRNPISPDGWMDMGGEAGWVYVGRSASQRGQ